MIGQTNSFTIGKDTALTVYATPLDSYYLLRDEKVFVKKINFSVQTAFSQSLSESSNGANSYLEPFFIDDETIFCLAPQADYSLCYSISGTQWGASSAASYLSSLAYASYRCLACGPCLVIGGRHYLLSATSTPLDLTDNSNFYVGRFYNRDYAVSTVDGSIYLYDWETKSSSTLKLSRSITYLTHGADENGRQFFIQDTSNSVYMMKVNSSGSVTQRGSSTLNGTIVAYTGLTDGNYVFVVSDTASVYNKHYLSYADSSILAGDGNCSLTIYRSNGKGSFTEIGSSSSLYRFNRLSKAIVHFDNRTKILTIGTVDNVYLFYWNSIEQLFDEIVIDGLELPVNPDGAHIYNAAVSEHLKNLIIFCGNAYDGGRNVKIYSLSDLASGIWKTVPQSVAASDISSVISAFATGQLQNNKAELRLLLPEPITFNLEITPTPDEFAFLGDE